jgi:ABC-type nitrate/sulfonate/bicarbonate transport system substrate-binding protein
MAYQPIVFGLPVFVGLEEKIFEHNHLQVEAMPFTSANDMLNALLAGQIDIIPGSPLVPVVSLEAKYPGRFRVFSHSVMTSAKPFDRILVKNDSPIRSVHDLSGKKMALIPGTTALNVTRAYFSRQGLDSDKVTFVQLAPTAQLTALQSGAVDALYAYEPLVTIALDQGSFRPITGSIYAALLDPCPLVVSIVSRKFEREHPEAVRRSTQALAEIFKEMKEDPEKAAMSMVPYLKIPARLAPRVSIQSMTLPGQMNIANLQQFIDILRGIGEVTAQVDALALTEPTR